jgi:hypothetical protein
LDAAARRPFSFLTEFLPACGKDSVEKGRVVNTSNIDLLGPGPRFSADFSPPRGENLPRMRLPPFRKENCRGLRADGKAQRRQ